MNGEGKFQPLNMPGLDVALREVRGCTDITCGHHDPAVLGLNPERLGRAMETSAGVKWPKRWGPSDFAWVARQIAAIYSSLSAVPGTEPEKTVTE